MSSPWAEKQTTPRFQLLLAVSTQSAGRGWGTGHGQSGRLLCGSHLKLHHHSSLPPGNKVSSRQNPIPPRIQRAVRDRLTAGPYCLPIQRPSLSASPQHISRPANRQTVLEGWAGVTV